MRGDSFKGQKFGWPGFSLYTSFILLFAIKAKTCESVLFNRHVIVELTGLLRDRAADVTAS